jgi:uncharacterized membrane protein YgcG
VKRMPRSLFVLLTLLASIPAVARDLHWSKVEVDARLDRDGVLHVVEKQSIVFTGDWNGGERWFSNVGVLRFEGIDFWEEKSSRWISMPRGRLDLTHHYDWGEGHLRWRSRQPDDPEFRGTERSYALKYSLSNILSESGGKFRLDHDFGIPDRAGEIREFALKLDFDPSWRVSEGAPVRRQAVRPGESVRVQLNLEHSEGGVGVGTREALLRARQAAYSRAPDWLLLLLALVGVSALIFFERDFLRHEMATGRFDAGAKEEVNEEWLRKNIFTIRPEHVAVLWDEVIGPAEVAAILSRLCVEKKLKVEDLGLDLGVFGDRHLFRLTRLVPLERFSGVERTLLDGLLFEGRQSVTTAELRENYANSGFNPVFEIADPLGLEVERLPGMGQEELAPVSFMRTFGLIVVSTLLAFVAMISTGVLPTEFMAAVALCVMMMAASAAFAVTWIRPMIAGALTIRFFTAGFAFVPLMAAIIPWLVYELEAPRSEWFVSSVALLGVACASSVYNLAKSRNVLSRMKKRHQLMHAREFFASELQRDQPALHDDWAPYLVALDLSPGMEAWSKRHGGSSLSVVRSSSSSSSSSPDSGAWTGGGGAFGGAGATTSWAAIATTVSSSSSGPSGGSSGGGGGGGW